MLSDQPCRNCSHIVDSKFCGNCGQPLQIKRVDAHYILHEIQHILHFEKGILYTIKELLIRPGQNVRAFITDDRSRLVKPVIFIIITSLIYTLTNNFFHIEDGYVNYSEAKANSTSSIFHWIQQHYGYANMIMGIFISFWLKLFFKKYEYNFFEILILLCFVMGMGMLMFSVFSVVEGLTKLSMMKLSGIVGISYCVWAIAQFFNERIIMNYFKALVSYILGMACFSASVMLLGFIIDTVIS